MTARHAQAVVVVGILLICASCAGSRFGNNPATSSVASPSALASVDPSLGDGLTEAQAIEAARQDLSTADQDAPVWATMAGSYGEVYASLAHRPNDDEQPPPAGPDRLDDPVWGISFHVSVEVCPPLGRTCETRDGLRTVLIDYVTGERLRTTTYGPPPGDPLPTPRPATD